MSEFGHRQQLTLEQALRETAWQLTELELLLQDYTVERERLLAQARQLRAELEHLTAAEHL